MLRNHYFKKDDVITVKTFQITDTEIKYKELNNLGGPLYTLIKSDVFSIKYQNEIKTVFDNIQSNVPSNQTTNKKHESAVVKSEEDSSDFAKVKEKAFGKLSNLFQ